MSYLTRLFKSIFELHMSMTPEFWLEVKRLFADALERPADEQEAFLDAACEGNIALRDEVASLLASHYKGYTLDNVGKAWVSPLLNSLKDHYEPGTRIGSFEIDRELGRGGMGRVYLARDVHLNRPVALKVLPRALQSEEESRDRFLLEAQAASALDHPNVCTIYAIDSVPDGQFYIAMAYYEGRTLKDCLLEGPFLVEEALDVATQIAKGLAAVHEAGIVHRDIKPANILRTKKGTIKILDFGIARIKHFKRVTRPGIRLGTAAYMAPEHIEGEDVDARTDVWAMGVVLYEMVAGIRPFNGNSTEAILTRVLHEDPPVLTALRPEVPREVWRVIERMLQKKPADRFSSMQEVLDALRECKESLAVFGVPHKTVFPAMLSSFIGRDRELEEVRSLLDESRLLTLTGPGGIGKTRLAVEAVSQMKETFQDGVYYVPLSTITEASQVVPAIVHALEGVKRGVQPSFEEIKKKFAPLKVLLLIDNFEQVAAASPRIEEFLIACPLIKVMITSRIPLGVEGEQEYRVPALEVPDAAAGDLQGVDILQQFSALSLFVERAKLVRPSFTLTEENREDVIALCQRLDGLPLALELAAARSKLLTPSMLRKRLADRLDLLKGGGTERPKRQQTLEQTIRWSYELLDQTLQLFFRRLAVFKGGFSLEAAERILKEVSGSWDVIDAISTLLDHSLIQTRDRFGESRMVMLETIRTYAWQRLLESGEALPVQRIHAMYFVELAETNEPALVSTDAASALNRLEIEFGNLQTALHYAEQQQDVELGLRLGTALWRYCLARGYMREGRAWLETFLNMHRENVPLRIQINALNSAGSLAHNQGDNHAAQILLKESLNLCRKDNDEQGLAAVLNNLSWVACELCDLEPAQALAEEALELCTALGDVRGSALAINNQGWVAFYRGDLNQALALHTESLSLRRQVGDRAGEVFALANLALVRVLMKDFDGAGSQLDHALYLAQALQDDHMRAWALTVNAWMHYRQSRFSQSLALLNQAVPIWRADTHSSGLGWAQTTSGSVNLSLGSFEVAKEHLEEGLALWQQVDTGWGIAWSLYELGRLEEQKGDITAASALYEKSLQIRESIRDQVGIIECKSALESLASK